MITIDRPPANALTQPTLEEFAVLLEDLEGDRAVQAVIVTGTGKFFSAGLDLFEVFDASDVDFAAFTATFDRTFTRLFSFSKPMIAAVNGHAIAGGAVLAAVADRRVAADGGGKIGLTEISVGVPFPASVLQPVLFSCAGPALSEVLYFGQTYGVPAALERRLVDEVVPRDDLMSRADSIARDLGSRPAAAFAAIKRSLRADALAKISAHAPGADPVWAIWRTPEVRAAVEAFRARTLGAKSRS